MTPQREAKATSMSDGSPPGGQAADRAAMLAAVAVTLAFVGWIAVVQSGESRLFYGNAAKGRTAEVVASQSVSAKANEPPVSPADLALER